MRNISCLLVVNWWETGMVELNKTENVCMTQTEAHTNLCILDPSCIINWIHRANIICFHSVYIPFHSFPPWCYSPSGPWPPSADTSVLLCLLPVASILVFLESVMFSTRDILPSYCWFSPWSWIMIFHIKRVFLGVFSSSSLTKWPAHPSLLILISSNIFRSLYKL